MRIISGKSRGTKLETIEGIQTRPTTDRVKESLFNLLQYDFYDKHILDLFAGSGALGLEGISRGAQKATFVDQNKSCVEVIKKNLIKIKSLEQATILQSDVNFAIAQLKPKEIDIVFMDPPYHKDLILPALEAMIAHDILSNSAMVVVEHEKTDLWDVPKGYECVKSRTYGITTLTILRRTQ